MGNTFEQGRDGYMVLGADGYSAPIWVGNSTFACLECVVEADNAIDGYLTVQGTNSKTDYWAIPLMDETGTTEDGHITAACVQPIELSDVTCGYVRLKWRHVSGAAGLTIRPVVK
jgi:hypothetical protein